MKHLHSAQVIGNFAGGNSEFMLLMGSLGR